MKSYPHPKVRKYQGILLMHWLIHIIHREKCGFYRIFMETTGTNVLCRNHKKHKYETFFIFSIDFGNVKNLGKYSENNGI